VNQRIFELARQSGMVQILEEHASEYGNGQFENTPYPELELFAQLIVEECTAKIEAAAEHSPELYGVALDLQEHFGVDS
jgi:hypothetical protein